MKKYIFPEITFCDFKSDSTIANIIDDNVNISGIGNNGPLDPDIDD